MPATNPDRAVLAENYLSERRKVVCQVQCSSCEFTCSSLRVCRACMCQSCSKKVEDAVPEGRRYRELWQVEAPLPNQLALLVEPQQFGPAWFVPQISSSNHESVSFVLDSNDVVVGKRVAGLNEGFTRRTYQ